MFLLNAPLLRAQGEATEFEEVVRKGMTIDFGVFLSSMKPSLADCRVVFKGVGADSVFVHSLKMLEEYKQEQGPIGSTYPYFRIFPVITEDVPTDRMAATGGMQSTQDWLQPRITMYYLQYLRGPDETAGYSFRYFVKVKDHWVFFPKPWRALTFGK